MKKVAIAFSFLLVSGTVLHAQDIKKARTAYNLTLLPNAKPEILESAKVEVDKLSADPKTSAQAESHLLKMEVYSALAAKSDLSAKYPNADVEAYAALNKYLELEPSAEKLKTDNYAGLNNIYNTFFNKGVKAYQAQSWDSAFMKFRDMASLGDLLIARKWSTASFDTTSYLYAAASAQNSKKETEAIKYYSKLADIKVTGKDYEGVYEYLTKYYLNNPNDELFKKYIGLAKEVFPANTLWKDLEFEYGKKNSDLPSVVKRFDEGDQGNTLTADEYSDYGNFFASDEKVRALPENEKATYTAKALYAFQKAYSKDTSNGIAAYNAGVTAYSNFEVVADSARSIKGTTADIKARQTAAKKEVNKAADLSIEWLEKAHKSLLGKTNRSNLEKGLLNKSVDLLYNVYEYKRDLARGVNVKDYDAFDAKMNYYNGLHGKY